MANAAEKLFDRVLSQLPTPPVWADELDDTPETSDQIDRPPETKDSELFPLGRLAVTDRVFDSIAGGLTVPEPSAEEKALIEGGIRVRGMEAIAFYKSRRFIDKKPFPGKWGIFLLQQGLNHLAWRISKEYPGYADPRGLAREFLRTHEFFHFRADIHTLMLEATLGRYLYLPTRHNFRGMRSDFVEEALANRQAFDWAKGRGVGLEEFAADFMMLQPGAYSRFLEPLETLTGEWAANVIDGLGPQCPPRLEFAHWVTETPKHYLRRSLCPEYVVFPDTLSDWIDPAWALQPINNIEEAESLSKLLGKKLRHLRDDWEKTKLKLMMDNTLPGLDFKPWRPDGKKSWSVKVSDGNRAHLSNEGGGNWLAYAIGGHKEMGHG